MGYATWFMFATGDALTTNPFIYGAKAFGGVSCWCVQINDKDKSFATFGFNDSAFWSNQQAGQLERYLMPLNLGGFNQSYENISKRGEKIEDKSRGSNGTRNS
jgi:hypothetical protein